MNWMRRKIPWIAGTAVAGFVVWQIATAVTTFQTTQSASAGRLFGRAVSADEYTQAVEAVTREAVLRHGDRFREIVPQEEMQHQAWERLLFLTEARRKGIRVGNREVIESIQKEPIFQTKGQFDPEGYQAIITYSLGTTPRLFEEQTRENLMIQKLVDQALGDSKVAEEEIRRTFQIKEESIRLRYLPLPDRSLAQEVADVSRQRPDQMDRVAKQLRLEIAGSDFVKREDEVPELGKAGAIFGLVFPLQPEEVSPSALPSSAGWLVAQLQAKRPADEEKFHALRDQMEKETVSRKRLQNYFAWYQELTQRAQKAQKGSGTL